MNFGFGISKFSRIAPLTEFFKILGFPLYTVKIGVLVSSKFGKLTERDF
jgi:hypothetical protein